MQIKLKSLDYYVFICLKDTKNNTPRNISKYLKVDLPHIYNSLNRLIKINKIHKTNIRPAEYMLINKMDINKQMEAVKKDPALMLGLFRTMMDSSKILRKILIKAVIEKKHQKEAMKEWQKITREEREEWIKKNYLGENYNIDLFINACYMLKNTKDEKIILKYLVDNVKDEKKIIENKR